jgi:hypothetical protein
MRNDHPWESKSVSRTSGGPRLWLIIFMRSNIAEQLIEKGLATVLRHKRDDEDRSAELDKLIVAEQA